MRTTCPLFFGEGRGASSVARSGRAVTFWRTSTLTRRSFDSTRKTPPAPVIVVPWKRRRVRITSPELGMDDRFDVRDRTVPRKNASERSIISRGIGREARPINRPTPDEFPGDWRAYVGLHRDLAESRLSLRRTARSAALILVSRCERVLLWRWTAAEKKCACSKQVPTGRSNVAALGHPPQPRPPTTRAPVRQGRARCPTDLHPDHRRVDGWARALDPRCLGSPTKRGNVRCQCAGFASPFNA